MKLTVTKKAKGEVIFPSLGGVSVMSGQSFSVSKDQFYSNDIQIGIRIGFLYIDESDKENKVELDARVEVKNISGKPLGIHTISLLPEETRFVSEEEASHELVKRAAAAGMIELTFPDEDVEEVEEKPKKSKAKNKATKKEKTVRKKRPKPADDKEQETNDDEEKSTKDEYNNKSHVWDAQTQSIIDKEESESRVLTKLEKKNHDSKEGDVQVGEIDFTESETNAEPKKKPKIKLKASSSKKQEQKSKSIKPVGQVKQSSSSLPNEEEISFVDIEQTRERLQARGLADQNEEIE